MTTPPLEGSERSAPTEKLPVGDPESDRMHPRPIVRGKARSGSAAGEVLETLAIAVILFFAMRLLVLPVRVEGTSMVPTLANRQQLLVSRRAYTHWAIGGHTFYLFGKPHRGDIVVLTPPPQEPQQGIPFIKRIIGLPGERVLVKDGTVYINDRPITEPYIAEPPAYTWPPTGQPYLVPANDVIVFGDNRNRSEDSSRFGVLPEDLIRGRAVAAFYPLNDLGFLPHPEYGA
ncbi:MAG: signal peptidase I, partial [Thermomicrobia bacterium]|nr:signal peptidase I [Thermomicrobia bacterium]